MWALGHHWTSMVNLTESFEYITLFEDISVKCMGPVYVNTSFNV